MIFHEFIYEFWYEFFSRTLLGTPKFIFFHESRQISWILASFHGRDHIGNHVWKYREECRDLMEWFVWILHWIHGRWAPTPVCYGPGLSAAAAPASPTAGLHSVLAASAPSVSPTWISAASLWSKCRLGVSPLQAAHHQFKFSPVTSVQVHVRVGALPRVLSESRYMTSVQHSKWLWPIAINLPTWSQ